MSQQVRAVFDGKRVRFLDAVHIPANTPLLVTILQDDEADERSISHPNAGDSLFYISPEREAMLREARSFESQREQLAKQYPGEYVALFQGRVVDHDRDRIALLHRVEKSYPDKFVLIRPTSPLAKPPLRMPAPRIRRNFR